MGQGDTEHASKPCEGERDEGKETAESAEEERGEVEPRMHATSEKITDRENIMTECS